MDPATSILQWARKVQAIAQNGLTFSQDTFDRERFEHKFGAQLAAQAGTVRAAEHTTNESSTDDRM